MMSVYFKGYRITSCETKKQIQNVETDKNLSVEYDLCDISIHVFVLCPLSPTQSL